MTAPGWVSLPETSGDLEATLQIAWLPSDSHHGASLELSVFGDPATELSWADGCLPGEWLGVESVAGPTELRSGLPQP